MSTYLGSIPRRSLLMGAAGLGLTGALFSGLRGARAEALAGRPPVVDRLSIRVVTDSYHHALEPSGRIGDVLVERTAFDLSRESPPKTLLNEWGLALHLESATGAERRQVLVDFGFTAQALNSNLDLLHIDPARLDALLLTHGHYDHFGGLVGFLRAHGSRLRPQLPLYVGGEECFCAREVGPPGSGLSFGVLDRQAIADAKLRLVDAQAPSVLADHGFTTGWIPGVSFETPAPTTRMKVGRLPNGLGCAPEGLPEEKRSRTELLDDFQHEQATCYLVKGKGLVVMTSCGHRGIVNSVRAAMKVSGVDQVHAVVGGFHLMPTPDNYVQATVAALKELKPAWLIPMHCSGARFYELARQEMPGRVLLSSKGTRFTFGA